jgi:hypothetical protein
MRMHCSRQVTAFLRSLGAEGEALRRAVESLKTNPTPDWALPVPDEPGMYDWLVEGCWVTYEIDISNASETVIRAILIEPNQAI